VIAVRRGHRGPFRFGLAMLEGLARYRIDRHRHQYDTLENVPANS